MSKFDKCFNEAFGEERPLEIKEVRVFPYAFSPAECQEIFERFKRSFSLELLQNSTEPDEYINNQIIPDRLRDEGAYARLHVSINPAPIPDFEWLPSDFLNSMFRTDAHPGR